MKKKIVIRAIISIIVIIVAAILLLKNNEIKTIQTGTINQEDTSYKKSQDINNIINVAKKKIIQMIGRR